MSMGRMTQDNLVDIDLGKEGRANKVSRQQVFFTRGAISHKRREKTFSLPPSVPNSSRILYYSYQIFGT